MRIRSRAFTRVGAAILASTLLVAGCADSGDTKDDDAGKGGNNGGNTSDSLSKEEIWADGWYNIDEAPGEPKSGGVLTVGDYGEPRSLDPTVTIPNGAVGGSAMAAIYDLLIRWDADEEQFVPHMAESLTTEDNVTWTLKLREGVKFSDGTPLNSAAVLGSIGYYMQNQGFNVLILATNIKEMKPVDDLTVEFVMNAPYASFPSMLATGPGMILAPAAIKGGQEKFKPIGAGPFVFDNYKPSEELTLKRNDDYWGDKPYLDGLRFVWPASDQARLDALKNGDIDQGSVRQPEVLETARKEGWPGRVEATGLGSMLFINNAEGRPGNDIRIRQAINLAVDPEAFLARTSNGAGIATRSLYTTSAPYYEEIELPETDVAAAKALVEEAKADGVDTTLTLITQSDQTSTTGSVTLKAMLEEAGLTVEVEQLKSIPDQTNRLYVTGDYDIATGSLGIPISDPFSRFTSGLLGASPANAMRYSNPEMDKLINQLQGADAEAAKPILTEIHKLWQETVPSVGYAAGAFFFPWQKTVHGIEASSESLLLYGKAWKE